MERNNYIHASPGEGTGKFDPGGTHKPPSAGRKDCVAEYIEKNLNAAELAEDIQKMVTQRIQDSIPDEKRLMMDLVAQVGELTGEVKELRKQLDSKPYAVFSCPSNQIKDISVELAEIRQLLQEDPKPQEMAVADIDPILLGPVQGMEQEAKTPQAPEPPAPPPATEEPQPTPPTEEAQAAPEHVEPATVEMPPVVSGNSKGKKKQKIWSVCGNILFYAVLIGVVICAFLAKSGSGGQPTVIAGYSAFTVLSSSMEDTYPKGSLIVTHSVDPNTLEVGDDITYMASATSTITHRIIGITENYLDTGARAFETKGTMNEKPDKDLVAAANVVGEVVFCSVLLGQAASFVSANWPLLIFFVVVLGALILFLRWNFSREESTPEKDGKHHKRDVKPEKT